MSNNPVLETITVGSTQYDLNDPRLVIGSDTTKYLRNDGTWQTPPTGETYSDATTSTHGLMSATDKVAVNKIGTGSLNTTNQNIIAAINELKSNVDNGLNPRVAQYKGSFIGYISYYNTTDVSLFTTSFACCVSGTLYYTAPNGNGVTYTSAIYLKDSTTNTTYYLTTITSVAGDSTLKTLTIPELYFPSGHALAIYAPSNSSVSITFNCSEYVVTAKETNVV